MKRYVFMIFMCLFFTEFAQAVGIGTAAGNMHDVTKMVAGIVEVIMYVAGVGVFVSSVMKYRLHRQNPQQVHISTPITELVLAIVLVLVPIIARYGNDFVFQDTPEGATTQMVRQLPR